MPTLQCSRVYSHHAGPAGPSGFICLPPVRFVICLSVVVLYSSPMLFFALKKSLYGLPIAIRMFLCLTSYCCGLAMSLNSCKKDPQKGTSAPAVCNSIEMLIPVGFCENGAPCGDPQVRPGSHFPQSNTLVVSLSRQICVYVCMYVCMYVYIYIVKLPRLVASCSYPQCVCH